MLGTIIKLPFLMVTIPSLLFQTAVSTDDIDQWFSSLSVHQNHLGGLLEHRLLGPTQKVCDAVEQEQGPRIYLANKFPDDDGNTGQGTTS